MAAEHIAIAIAYKIAHRLKPAAYQHGSMATQQILAWRHQTNNGA